VELLVRRLVVLEGVHLREVVPAGNLAQREDQGFGRVAAVGVLLGQRRRLLDLIGRAPGGEIRLGQPLPDGQTADEALDLPEQLVLGVEGQRGHALGLGLEV
jgi:hypothetical protein